MKLQQKIWQVDKVKLGEIMGHGFFQPFSLVWFLHTNGFF